MRSVRSSMQINIGISGNEIPEIPGHFDLSEAESSSLNPGHYPI